MCDYGWDLFDAHVVCKMLGYYGAVNATNAAYFGEGSGPVQLHNVRCTAADKHLHDCLQYSYLSRSLPSYCSRGHSQDAGVVCSGLCMVLQNVIGIYINILMYIDMSTV